MRTIHKVLMVAVLLAAMVAPAAAFQSTTFPEPRAGGNEVVFAVNAGGDSIAVGDWVQIALGSQVATSLSGRYDTGVMVVKAPATENTGTILGVSLQAADTGQWLTVLTRGYTTAYVDGSDTNTASGISARGRISITDKAGFAGSTFYIGGVVTTAADLTSMQTVGWVCEAVTTSETTALQPVYVDCR